MSSGTTCAAVGCHNNSRKLKVSSKTSRVEHEQQTCPCPAEEGGAETSTARSFETEINIWVYENRPQKSCCVSAHLVLFRQSQGCSSLCAATGHLLHSAEFRKPADEQLGKMRL